jgi:hypothetical protein
VRIIFYFPSYLQSFGEEVSFTANVLAAVGDGCTADIWKEGERLCAWIGIDVRAEGTSIFL